MVARYPLFYDEPLYRARDFVMMSCANITAPAFPLHPHSPTPRGSTGGLADGGVGGGGSCSNLPEGGVFVGSATVTLALPVVSGDPDAPAALAIKFTLDGA